MNLLEIEQQTPQWASARIGNVTASRMADAMSFLTRASGGRKAGDSSQKRLDYIMEKALERITGQEAWHYVTPAMQDGIDREDHAREVYWVITNAKAKKCGLALHPTIKGFMASPDGLIGEDGIWEGKCPTQAVHFEYLQAGIVPDEYLPQCLSQLACLPDRKWIDFTSFHPEFPPSLQMFIVRMYREDWLEQIEQVEKAAIAVLAEIDATEARLREIASRGIKDTKRVLPGTLPSESSSLSPKTNLIDSAMQSAGLTNSDLPAWARR